MAIIHFKLGVTEISRDDEGLVELANTVVRQMQKFGHAVQLDTQRASDNKFLAARVTHYLTCRACAEIKREEKEQQLGKQERDVAKDKGKVQFTGLSGTTGLASTDRRREVGILGIGSEGTNPALLADHLAEERTRGQDQVLQCDAGSHLPTVESPTRRPGIAESNAGLRDYSILTSGTIPLDRGSGQTTAVGHGRRNAGDTHSKLHDSPKHSHRTVNKRAKLTRGSRRIHKDKSKSKKR